MDEIVTYRIIDGQGMRRGVGITDLATARAEVSRLLDFSVMPMTFTIERVTVTIQRREEAVELHGPQQMLTTSDP